MKTIFKSVVVFTLALLARAVVRRYHPRIIMVTGSVGKTTTKDAVAMALSSRFYVRKSSKSFNSEFGVPFTIFGVDNPWGNPLAWLSLVKNAIALLILPNHYPNLLVLEVGADKPGDLARILKIATPDVVVVTRLPDVPVHVEAYASPEAVREEEFSPAGALVSDAPLIISADDSYSCVAVRHSPARVISYGVADTADVRVSACTFLLDKGSVTGMRARISVKGEECEIVVRGSVGATQVAPLAAALATALALDIPLAEATGALDEYVPPPGRGRLLAGKQGSTLIDDTYNASPVAVEEALATLRAFPLSVGGEGSAPRRIMVLGDMLELGRYSVAEHERIGALARESADLVIAIGIRSRVFVKSPGRAEVQLYDDSATAAAALVTQVVSGDVLLVKGSQSVRTERVVLALLNDPTDACKLVRQERQWSRL